MFLPRRRDSRECPGPISEATLHCPSPSRAFTAGAIALAVISPALDPVEHAAEALPPAQPAGPETSENVHLDAPDALDERAATAERASRAAPRHLAFARRAATTEARTLINPFALPDGGQALRNAVELAVADEREALRTAETQAAVDLRDDLRGDPVATPEVVPDLDVLFAEADRTARELAARRALAVRKSELRKSALRQAGLRNARDSGSVRPMLTDDDTGYDARDRVVTGYQRQVVTRHATVKRSQRVMRLGSGMTAVIAFARSQVGKRYVTGGTGPGGFDCSGFTKRAYALAGIRLPHSSGAQAARSRGVSRSQARAGDLVVGPGHVGIYMGRGMMIDAGNHRTGVVYRKVYNGLRVARIR